ncbi:chromosome segregation protein SMC [Anaerolineales bacterium HSG25]|nr:chromosome segregation protein SMC [Anaerolineales bacterium HSG25]
MRLKSIEIQGYKSFAKKVQLVFDQGLTAVVGPNGSGKSNVVDAIRWVLGEQSYSSLRGRKTADMIFSGSDGRARLSMAVVTLLLDNTAKWLPLDFSEVTISRRAYRSGENEYYLNDSRVRLKDVVELLAQGGMSRQTYTVIGQGTIDQILALQSGERRKLFEEAAGITFHRQKRVESLKRLEETRANLIRVNDLVQEIEPQLKRLSRQAKRATDHYGLISELAEKLQIWYGYQWRTAQRRMHQAEIALKTSENSFKVQQKQLQELETQIAALRQQQADLRQNMGEQYGQNQQLNRQADGVQREMAVNDERLRQFATQRQEIADDLAVLENSLSAHHEQIALDETELDQIKTAYQAAELELRQTSQQLATHQAEQKEIVSQRVLIERERQRLETDLAKRQTQQNQLLERRETLTQEQSDYTAEVARLQDEQVRLQAEHDEQAQRLVGLADSITELETDRNEGRGQLITLIERGEQLQEQLKPLDQQREGLKARQDVLGKLRADMDGYHEGVRAILHQKNGLTGIIGPVSRIIQVPPELEVAIEVALGGRLQDIVVEDFATAQKAVAYLKQKRLGRATFLPLDTLRVLSPAQLPKTAGVVGLASVLVQVETGLEKVAEFTLNRTIVAEDLASARQAFEAMRGGFNLVTYDGELMRSSGTVTGGQSRGKRGRQGTFLAREREWRELPEQLARLAEKRRAVSTELEQNRHEIATLENEIQRLSDARRERFKQRDQLQTEVTKLSRGIEQVVNNIGWQQELQSKGQAELSRLAERETESQQDVQQVETALQKLTSTINQLSTEIDSLADTKLVAAVEAAKTAVSEVREKQQKQQLLLDNHQTILRQLTNQIKSKQSRGQMLAQEEAQLQTKQTSLQEQRQQLQAQQNEQKGTFETLEQTSNEIATTLSQQEQVERNTRKQWQRLESDLRAASITATRAQDTVANLTRQVEDDLGLVMLELAEYDRPKPVLSVAESSASQEAEGQQTEGQQIEGQETEEQNGEIVVKDGLTVQLEMTMESPPEVELITPDQLPEVDELPPKLEVELKQLRNKVRRLGNINQDAPREHAELKTRYDFLTTQMSDLESAAENLREVISKLDDIMRESFIETFQQVSVEFKKYFKAMFGGGEANIILTDPDDLSVSGVDIMARPPGKRLQSMALLSGGERSLTAQALIFSLLRISPTPFVIFDEVDAMLDEANVSRFRDALVGLANDIQFIVVTHNRKTIEAARTIYGVSMGADSVSQIYSLRLDEWTEQIDEQ